MKKFALPALFLGLALAVGVIAEQGIDDIGAALGRAGLSLLWLVPYFLVPFSLAGGAWYLLIPADARPDFSGVMTAAWIGTSINWLLPVAQLGGEIAKAIWLARRAKPASMMVATAVVDKVLQTATQALVALVGVGLLLTVANETGLAPTAVGIALALLALFAAFLFAQRFGLFTRPAAFAQRLIEKAATWRGIDVEKEMLRLACGANSIDGASRQTCASPARMGLSLAIRLPSRLSMAGEVWLALYLMGYPISIAEALMIECLGQTVRSAAFVVPGAYGVQETAYILIGALVGVPPDIALTVSLAKRLREFLVGVPGLIYWQLGETRLKTETG